MDIWKTYVLFTSTGLAPGISSDSGPRYIAIGRVHARDIWKKDIMPIYLGN